MMRSEGNMSLRNPVIPPGIDPGIVRLVAQRLNHYATPGPRNGTYKVGKFAKEFITDFITGLSYETWGN